MYLVPLAKDIQFKYTGSISIYSQKKTNTRIRIYVYGWKVTLPFFAMFAWIALFFVDGRKWSFRYDIVDSF